jgi:hypothetical protein
MKELYQAQLNGNKVFFVREIDNTIGNMFNTLTEAMRFFDGEKRSPFGIAVNNEVMCQGASVGWLKDIKLLK